MKGLLAFAFIFLAGIAPASAAPSPILFFTDLTSGPKTGNSDISRAGQISGEDGAIVTVWGRNLGSSQGASQITVGGIAARIYTWGNATAPADLYSKLGLQMVAFQIPHSAPDGDTPIRATVGGVTTNSLPFKIRTGNIYFVKTSGNNTTGTGSWSNPWQTISQSQYWLGAIAQVMPGDILYVGDSVQQIEEDGDHSAINLDIDANNIATVSMPKALVGYPGANATIGSDAVSNAWTTFCSGSLTGSLNWTVAKFNLTGNQMGAEMSSGFRLVGNKVTAPQGDQPTGAIGGAGDHLYLLGNEVTNTGYFGTSKLYHPIYIQSTECDSTACLPPGLSRLPTETDREIAWNFLHDNYSYDGINIYREGTYSAYMTNHRIHDNYILNQTGRGMLIGGFVTGDNFIYNNVIINGGAGPDSVADGVALHVCAQIQAGGPGSPPATNIHFFNNTLAGCGWSGETTDWATGAVSFLNLTQYGFANYQLDFRNNIVYSTQPYEPAYSTDIPNITASHNIWFGAGTPPTWDSSAINTDPKFVNLAARDLHVLSTSPAVDSGSSASPIPDNDFDSVVRPQDGAFDIGAFELDQNSPPTPSPTPTPTATPTASPTPNPTSTPSPTPTNAPTPTPKPTTIIKAVNVSPSFGARTRAEVNGTVYRSNGKHTPILGVKISLFCGNKLLGNRSSSRQGKVSYAFARPAKKMSCYLKGNGVRSNSVSISARKTAF